MHINFVTHNKGKVEEAKLILEPGIMVDHIDLEYEEVQHDDPEHVARVSAELVSTRLNKPVVVDDSGFFISALQGFPGTFSATIYHQLGLQGLVKLMEGIEDRECFYKTAVAYCEPGRKAVSFLGVEKGTMAHSIRGSFGFGHDAVFIPEGEQRTYGEIEGCEMMKRFRKSAFNQLRDYLTTTRR